MSIMNWGESKTILAEVEQLFSRDDDIKDVRDICRMGNEIEAIYKNSLSDSREMIKRMC